MRVDFSANSKTSHSPFTATSVTYTATHHKTVIVALQFNSHESVQKLFYNLHIIFSNSLVFFKVICQLEKEPLKGLANVQEIFS